MSLAHLTLLGHSAHNLLQNLILDSCHTPSNLDSDKSDSDSDLLCPCLTLIKTLSTCLERLPTLAKQPSSILAGAECEWRLRGVQLFTSSKEMLVASLQPRRAPDCDLPGVLIPAQGQGEAGPQAVHWQVHIRACKEKQVSICRRAG